MALKDTNYMYASALIRSREGIVPYNEKINAYLESKTTDSLFSAVFPNTTIKDNSFSLDKAIESSIEETAELIKKLAPQKDAFDFLFYEFDCCNIKTIIKAKIKNSSYEGMLFSYGTVPVDVLIEAFKENKYTKLPKNMALAVDEAFKAYSTTNDPKTIDFVMDKACFNDMDENVTKYKVSMFKKLVMIRADFINILSFERINRSDIVDKKGTFSNVFVKGGQVGLKNYISFYDGKENGLKDILYGTKYKDVIVQLGEDFELSTLEKPIDSLYLSVVKDVKFKAFGPEILCAFFVNKLYEMKNVRIIYAGLKSEIPKETIKERLRLYE